ncbi:hypothetical protein ACVWW6_000039 [Bradyrhizobium sp. USDA 3311]
MTPSSQARQAYLGRRVTRSGTAPGPGPAACFDPRRSGATCSGSRDRSCRRYRRRPRSAAGAPARHKVAAALASPRLTAFMCAHVLRRFAVRCDLLDVFQAEQHLIFTLRLCAPTKPMSLQFLDDLSQPFALAPLGEQHRFQRLGIVRQGVTHIQFRAYSPPSGDASDATDSLRRSIANSYPAGVGAGVSRASCTSRQSRPSSSADNCAADRRITPSWILGQRKITCSSRLANRLRPVPSQNTSLIRSARLAP